MHKQKAKTANLKGKREGELKNYVFDFLYSKDFSIIYEILFLKFSTF